MINKKYLSNMIPKLTTVNELGTLRKTGHLKLSNRIREKMIQQVRAGPGGMNMDSSRTPQKKVIQLTDDEIITEWVLSEIQPEDYTFGRKAHLYTEIRKRINRAKKAKDDGYVKEWHQKLKGFEKPGGS